MIKVLGSPWLAFPALGIKPDWPERQVQATVYLAQLLGVDLAYHFSLLGPHPTSLDLSVDFADWREADGPGEALEEVSRRYELALGALTSCQKAEWLAVLCSVHYFATRPGCSAEAYQSQYREWGPELVVQAKSELAQAGLLKPSGIQADTIQAFPAELLSDEAKARQLLDEAIAVWEKLGYQAKVSLQPKGGTDEHPDGATLAAARPARAATAA